MGCKHTFKSNIIDFWFIVILQNEARLALILFKIIMAAHRMRDIFKRLNFPDSNVSVLTTACYISDIFVDFSCKIKVSYCIHMAQKRELIFENLLS
jgi:hypothetical protein